MTERDDTPALAALRLQGWQYQALKDAEGSPQHYLTLSRGDQAELVAEVHALPSGKEALFFGVKCATSETGAAPVLTLVAGTWVPVTADLAEDVKGARRKLARVLKGAIVAVEVK